MRAVRLNQNSKNVLKLNQGAKEAKKLGRAAEVERSVRHCGSSDPVHIPFIVNTKKLIKIDYCRSFKALLYCPVATPNFLNVLPLYC